jgi:hypothetical protein
MIDVQRFGMTGGGAESGPGSSLDGCSLSIGPVVSLTSVCQHQPLHLTAEMFARSLKLVPLFKQTAVRGNTLRFFSLRYTESHEYIKVYLKFCCCNFHHFFLS